MTSELKPDLTSFGHADGGYMSKCSHCKETFIGAKRAWSCEPCAIKKSLEPKIEQPKPDVPELETVGIQHKRPVDGIWCNGESPYVGLPTRELVTRDQAAAMIADERQAAINARNLLQYEKDQQWQERAEAAEAEAKIETKDAEIEQAKKEINTLLVSYVREHFFENKTFKPLDSLIGQISQLDNAITITRDFKSRAEVAESKLAQIEKQEVVDDEPVYYALTDSDWSFDNQDEGRATIVLANSPEEAVRKATDIEIAEQGEGVGIHWKVAKLTLVGFQGAEWDNSKPSFDQFQPFTAPVASDADLRAENERLRGHAARIIAAFDEDNDLDNPEKFNAYFDLKSALNPSEPRT